jgi:diguanylate cyclase (GGDEF)-like protein/PAS domain S-box-containing protein
MRIRDFSIRLSLTLLILTASVLAVLLASVGFAIYDSQSYRASAVRELTALADTLGANTAASLVFNDQNTAKAMLGSLATEPHLLAARLYDAQGRVFAEYRRTNAPPSLVLPAWQSDGSVFERGSLVLFRGVQMNGERAGSIALVFDLSESRSRHIQYAKISVLVILLSVLATFIIASRLAYSIASPLVLLSAVTRRITIEKDYAVRARIPCGGETGFLVDSFNEMLSQIESREQALKDALKDLQESEERYALAAQGANDGLWDWNLATGEIYFSPRWNHMLGYEENEHWSTPEEWFAQVHPDDRERMRNEVDAHCKNETAELVSEYRMAHKSGGYIWTLSRGIAIRDASGAAIRIAGSQTDITEGKTADPLTRLPNRLYFIDRLESAIEAARLQETRFAVLFVDLDRFKMVNDSLGHAAGDELLIDVARRLRSATRQSARQGAPLQSVVARIGGDEFALLLSHIQSDKDAANIAARVLERLGEPFLIEGRSMFISASIGIADGACGQSPEDLLNNADTAMYRAKTNGKARYEFFDETMREQAISRFETETGLRKAIDEGQLVLHYQPIVSMEGLRICGFEALVRWNHPEHGLIYPDEFIPIAEQSDLIILLGRWVLRESCRQMAEWQKRLSPHPPLTVSVNVSVRQLNDRGLVEEVEMALAESGLNHASLALEMTESSIMGDAEQTLAILNHLKKMNIQLEIDDFGTGFSSLSRLQHLPFHILKIDRSFIKGLNTEPGSLDIVKAILQLAHSFRMKVIAEGVETEEQLCCLRDLGCDYLQGYLFSRPIDGNQAEQFFQKFRESGILSVLAAPVNN